jgi:hypothetical protein
MAKKRQAATRHYHFISYARKDERIAQPVFRELYGSGIDIWVDTDDIPAGAAWPDDIDQAIEGAAKFILMLSPFAVRSRQVWRELALALKLGKPVVPVKLRPVKLPPRIVKALGNLQILSLTQYRQERSGLLIDALNEVASARVPKHRQRVFRRNQRFIAETLRFLQEVTFCGGHLIVGVVTDPPNEAVYVQFAAINGLSDVRGEAVGNTNLPPQSQLTEEQMDKLLEQGWNDPEEGFGGNYWREFHCETDADRRTVANFALRTLLDVYGHLAGEEIVPEIGFNS